MKNIILGLILGVSIMLNIATIPGESMFITKPKVPVNTRLVKCISGDDAKLKLGEYFKMGFIVKTYEIYNGYHFVVIEKY